jgi:hypothetical protein
MPFCKDPSNSKILVNLARVALGGTNPDRPAACGQRCLVGLVGRGVSDNVFNFGRWHFQSLSKRVQPKC